MVDGRLIDSIAAHNIISPQWVGYTPVISASSGTINSYTVNTASYLLLSRNLVYVMVTATINDNGTGAVKLLVTVPIPRFTDFSSNDVNGLDGQNFTNHAMLKSTGLLNNATTFEVWKYDGTYPVSTGDQFFISGWYGPRL